MSYIQLYTIRVPYSYSYRYLVYTYSSQCDTNCPIIIFNVYTVLV